MPAETTLYIRKDASKMDTWDPVLLWYARAVGVMKGLPATDPTSWIYQAAIHGFTLDPNYDSDAATFWSSVTKGKPLPGASEQTKYWSQCQHGSWFFVPWHRMYIGYFEGIVRNIVVGLGGPATWALPYWGYEDSIPNARKLPAAFYQPTLPDGTPNPLLEPQRANGNDGAAFLTATEVSTSRAFSEHRFITPPHGIPEGFGGPQTGFDHLHNTPHGGLESQPHDQIHEAIGDLMGDPNTAGYDPIFYLHHANIDRLWSLWIRSNTANQNPTQTSWLNFAFNFHDSTKAEVTLTPAAVVDSVSSPFHYQYDDAPPTTLIAHSMEASVTPPTPATPIPAVPLTENPLPQMVGASSEPQALTNDPKTMGIRLFPLKAPLGILGSPESSYRYAYVLAENVRCQGKASGYDVYLNAPEGPGKPDDKYYLGSISTFGMNQASVASELHPGSGLTFTFDATKVINQLKAEGRWNPELLNVMFIIKRANKPGTSLEVGRVSLHYV
jgi:tyrosinase